MYYSDQMGDDSDGRPLCIMRSISMRDGAYEDRVWGIWVVLCMIPRVIFSRVDGIALG
jgi:hypothetical protein